METNKNENFSTEMNDEAMKKKISKAIYSKAFENRFNQTKGMKMLMKGKNGGAFYVAQLQEMNSKKVHIGIVIEYPDGTQSEMIKVKQSEYREIFTEGFIYPEKKSNKARKYPQAFKVLLDYETKKMPIPVKTIWNLIEEKYRLLPTKEYRASASIQEIYEGIAEFALDRANKNEKEYGFMVENGHYNIPILNMREVAALSDMSFRDLISKLDMHGMLSKDNDGRYQKAHKKNGHNYRTYSIKANIEINETEVLKNNVEIPEDEKDDEQEIEYMAEYKTKEQRLYKPNKKQHKSIEEEFITSRECSEVTEVTNNNQNNIVSIGIAGIKDKGTGAVSCK